MKKTRCFEGLIVLFLLIIASVSSATITLTDDDITTDESTLTIDFDDNWINVNNLTVNNFILSDLLPNPTLTLDLGSGANRWNWLYVHNVSSDNLNATVSIGTLGDLYVGGDANIIGDFSLDGDTTISGNLTVEENLHIDGITVMGAEGFLVSPTDTGASIRLNVTTGGDVYMAGTFNNDGNMNIADILEVIFWPGVDRVNITGLLNVEGNTIVTENVTANNIFLPAYLRASSKSTIPIAVGSWWYNITFNHSDCGLCEGFAHTYNDATNTTFTVNNSGIYRVTYVVTCEDTDATPDAHVGFRLVNATDHTIIKGSYGEFDTTKQNSHVFKEHNFITLFNASDTFKVQFISDDTTVTLQPHITFNPSGPSCQISLNKIANI